jgi:hypothetical protein
VNVAEEKKQAAEKEEPSIFVKYKGTFPEVYAPNLGTFHKGKARKFTDAFQIQQAKILVDGNPDFEEVEK